MARQLLIFNVSTNRAIAFYPQGGFHTPDYVGVPGADLDPNLSQVSGDLKYWKRVAGAWVMQTAQEQSDTDAAIALAATTALRAGAVALIDAGEGIDRRAIADMVVGELNSIRQWIMSFKVEVAAASSLADLKTRVAGLPNLNDRTLAQARTAYKNSINNGSVDS